MKNDIIQRLTKDQIVVELTNVIQMNSILHVRMLGVRRELDGLQKEFDDNKAIQDKLFKEIIKHL